MVEHYYGVYTMQSNAIEFIRVDNFLDDINRDGCFDTADMDGISPNYQILLVSDCASNIEDCIDADGTLITPYSSTNNTGANIIDTLGDEDGYCSMLWSKGVNGERTMSVADSTVSYEFGEEPVKIKAFFLVNIADGSGYVIAYAIMDKHIEKDTSLICPTDGMIWSIKYGG